MAEKTITQKIEEHFAVEKGEWLFERGKVKEGRLIKEAYHEINRLQRELRLVNDQNRAAWVANYTKDREFANREKSIVESEQAFQNRLRYLQEFVDYHKA